MNVDVFTETRGVIVSNGFGVAESYKNRCATGRSSTFPTFEYRIGVQYLLFDPRVLSARGREKLENQFRRFRFATTALAADNNTLIVLVTLHVPIGIVADGEYVGRQFTDLLVAVLSNGLDVVDG